MKLAIVPGSFDPMTLGHLDLIQRVAQKYDRVVVAVMQNKEKTYLFSPDERLQIAKQTILDLKNVSAIFDDGMLIDLYDRLGACAVCKGWRDEKDLVYEESMAEWNREHNPHFVTELFRATPVYEDYSSTRVRLAMEENEGLLGLVHPRAIPICLKKKKERTVKND